VTPDVTNVGSHLRVVFDDDRFWPMADIDASVRRRTARCGDVRFRPKADVIRNEVTTLVLQARASGCLGPPALKLKGEV
jgi:hypothetical protein